MAEGRAGSRAARVLWEHRRGILGVLVTLCILPLYVFFASVGTWSNWPENSRYYDDLATAFSEGHLYLNVQPPPALLSLSDPYDPPSRNSVPGLRAFVDEVWDLSFYHGRFYVYWGPAPAVPIAMLKLLHLGPIPDQFIVFACLTGVMVFGALLILRMRGRFHEDVPFVLVLAGIGAVALAWPIPAILSDAGIYEATIAAGQFFLVGGLYFASAGLELRSHSRASLIVAAIMWALAAASRTLLILPSAVLSFAMILWEWVHAPAKPLFKRIASASVLSLPLILVLLTLGWYNWARFGSVLDTGYRYVLSFDNLNATTSQSFSPAYLPPNLWMYVLNPFEIQSRFPFLSIAADRAPLIPYQGEAGKYHIEATTGLLPAAPFILLSLVAAAELAALVWARFSSSRSKDAIRRRRPAWTLASLGLAVVFAGAVVFFYYDVRIRYLAEFVPSLMLLSVLGAFEGYRLLQSRAVMRSVYTLCVVGIAIASSSMSMLLAMAENARRFRHYSPHLMRLLVLFFGR